MELSVKKEKIVAAMKELAAKGDIEVKPHQIIRQISEPWCFEFHYPAVNKIYAALMGLISDGVVSRRPIVPEMHSPRHLYKLETSQ